MPMKFTYKHKILLYFCVVFSIFTVGIVVFQSYRERIYKSEDLKNTLTGYTDIISAQIHRSNQNDTSDFGKTRQLLTLFPKNLRLTIINHDGRVLFDSDITDQELTDNHIQRDEIIEAEQLGRGSAIRKSKTTGKEYFYYAKSYEDYFIRAALPNDVEVQSQLKAERLFLYFVVGWFLIAFIALVVISDRFGQAITALRNFVTSTEKHIPDYDKMHLPDTELGEIVSKIAEGYKLLEQRSEQLESEREKLIRHFNYADEGLAIFAENRMVIYANSHFIQYLNTITDQSTALVNTMFSDPVFAKLKEFLDEQHEHASTPIFTLKIEKNNRCFEVRLLLFGDRSFEITLRDITSFELTRTLKQQITGNIAHELKTPVSSISGYIETLLSQRNLPEDKTQFFLERAHSQVIRLTELINDIALITKIEEAAELFDREPINVRDTLSEAVYDLKKTAAEQGDRIVMEVSEHIYVRGYKPLLYAIFRNLIENALTHAGSSVEISISCYMEDDTFYYFSFYDTGSGIPEKHLLRIFERFYRIDDGRSRLKGGGSGLGLSIVKNAIALHGGEIIAKNRKNGGLEFLFTLRK